MMLLLLLLLSVVVVQVLVLGLLQPFLRREPLAIEALLMRFWVLNQIEQHRDRGLVVVVRGSAAMLLGESSVCLARLVRLLQVFDCQRTRCSRCGYRTVRRSHCDSALTAIPLRCRHEGRCA